MEYHTINDYKCDFYGIDKYYGKPKYYIDTEIFHEHLEIIQHMIHDYHPVCFEGLDYNTIYIIDCATYQCLSRELEFDSKIVSRYNKDWNFETNNTEYEEICKDIYRYNCLNNHFYKDEQRMEQSKKILDMLYSRDKAFRGFDLDTLFVINVAIEYYIKILEDCMKNKASDDLYDS